ncbi:MAG: alpha-2-macroglobulin domain protein, partial [Myxococcales bacterium]|nr:alpha-2-macroglobulin domain protein [Myxococcales bacterium]
MKRQEWIAVVTGVIAFWAFAETKATCTDAWLRYGIVLGSCPDGKLRQTAHLEASGLRRGAKAVVHLTANAHFTLHDMDSVQQLPVNRFESITLTLVDAKNKVLPIAVPKWETNPGSAYATI